MPKYNPASALREHMLEGHPVTLLEALILFGVQNHSAEFARIRKDGFMIENRPVSMAKVLRRINEYTRCDAPSELPTKEIHLTEYWIKR